MVAEKLCKAYLLRTGQPPVRKHIGFSQFMRSLTSRLKSERQSAIPDAFGVKSAKQFVAMLAGFHRFAGELQRVAPAEAGNGPNAEYPWPDADPVHYPAGYEFGLWNELIDRGPGRRFLSFIERAVKEFPKYA